MLCRAKSTLCTLVGAQQLILSLEVFSSTLVLYAIQLYLQSQDAKLMSVRLPSFFSLSVST